METVFIKGLFGKTNSFRKLLNLSDTSTCISGIIHGSPKRNLCLSPVTSCFSGTPTYGNYTKGPKPSEVWKRVVDNPNYVIDTARLFFKEFVTLKNEFKEAFKIDVPLRNNMRIDMFFTFEDDESMKKFVLTTDSSHNQGFSTAQFIRTERNSGLFYGNIVTKPPDDGVTDYAGYASILSRRPFKSFRRASAHNLKNYTHLVLKIRGDGRTYMVILDTPHYYDVTWHDQYHYPLFTRGGPYWQLVKIPFSNFYFNAKGKIQDSQDVIEMDSIARFGITIADGIDGPFRLEVDYVGLEFQPYHKHICPYENYYVE